jgi:hypothetical protein
VCEVVPKVSARGKVHLHIKIVTDDIVVFDALADGF